MKIAVEGAPGSLTCPATSSWRREYSYDHFGRWGQLPGFGRADLDQPEQRAPKPGNCPPAQRYRWVSSNRTMHTAVPTSQSAISAGNNRLAAASYDAAGNMTSHPWITPGGSMAYNANNLMTSFTATGVSVQTAYDAAGRRVRKINGTEVTLWVYDASGRLAAEYRNGTGPGFAASAPEREYSYGVGRLVAVHEGTNRYYRTTDHLGSTRIVTDQTGAVKQRRDFFPFGEEIPADSSHGGRNAVTDGGVATYNASLGVRQQFTGQQRDSETGLDYFLARNLGAPLGRFLSIDPGSKGTRYDDPQTWNAYLYVKNSPFRYIDPTGTDPQCPPELRGDCGPGRGSSTPSPPNYPPPSPPSPDWGPEFCQLHGRDHELCPNFPIPADQYRHDLESGIWELFEPEILEAGPGSVMRAFGRGLLNAIAKTPSILRQAPLLGRYALKHATKDELVGMLRVSGQGQREFFHKIFGRTEAQAQQALELARQNRLDVPGAITRETVEIYREIARRVAGDPLNSGRVVQGTRLEIIDILISQGRI